MKIVYEFSFPDELMTDEVRAWASRPGSGICWFKDLTAMTCGPVISNMSGADHANWDKLQPFSVVGWHDSGMLTILHIVSLEPVYGEGTKLRPAGLLD